MVAIKILNLSFKRYQFMYISGLPFNYFERIDCKNVLSDKHIHKYGVVIFKLHEI